ncbi:phage major capsid protein [Blastopirellula marina]|uniref:Phage major capsid protein n=1 Tax=Blastopirellula marina TaxID=124 RepID=A0A2S8FLT1_9BACT|nr:MULTISPECIES: phage major capsid protein [Pirellulaceae]PQO33148.1 phage major capsid protein [Blastopirellula marina]RCS52237.1 phage major capsid protein [Bremerella cremea]
MNHYREKQKHHAESARAIHDLAKAEERELTKEELESFNNDVAMSEEYGNKAEKLEKLEAMESKMKESAGRISKPESFSEPVHEDVERFSVLRAIRLKLEGKQLDGVEAEVSDEIAKRSGRSAEGFYLPMTAKAQNFDLNVTTGAGGLNTTIDYGNFIELLRAQLLVQSLGARVMTDLNGTIQIPKQSGGATAYWINANGSNTITASNQTITQVPLAPNTLGCHTRYTRAFLKQTSMDVEQFILADLAAVRALEVDRAVFNGSGSGAEPEGLLQNSSVATVALGNDGGAPTFGKMVEMETAVASENALVGNLNYVTTPAGRGKLKTTPVESGNPRMIWEGSQINGYNAHATTLLPNDLTKGAYGENLSAAVFGNFNDVIVGMWGGVDVIVNPYSDDDAGAVKITLLGETDIAFRHVESFSKCIDMATS